MREMITNLEVQEFLTDFEQGSQTVILEEGREKDEIIEIAKAKGINLIKNTDLAGFKTVFMFANQANNNGARAPKQKLLKALPTMIGKPMDIDHIRNLVVGHYIDYRFRSKDNAVIAYGVFYKSNFGKEWERAKGLLKANKLGTSFEIWCPQNKRKRLEDGTYELTEMEIAGGGLMFKEKPAYEDAKVLELAKAHIEEAKDLIFASTQYKEEDMIRADYFKEEVLKNKAKLDAEKQAQADAEAQRRAQEYGVKCGHCGREFERADAGDIKCPSCFSILKRDGSVEFPPQIIDFRMSCPNCKVANWKLLKAGENNSEIKCMSCTKEYKVDFAKPKTNELIDKINFVYTGRVNCPQCSTGIPISGMSKSTNHEVACPKCSLKFSVDTAKIEKYKSIDKISELIPEPVKVNDSEGKEEKKEMTEETKNKEEVKKEDNKETTTEAPKVEEKTDTKTDTSEKSKTEETPKEAPKEEVKSEEKVETVEKSSENTEKEEKASEETVQTPPEESEDSVVELEEDDINETEADLVEMVESAVLTTEKRNAIDDKNFAVVKSVKNKKTGGTRKIRMFPINDEAHVRNALARLAQEAPQNTLAKLGVSVESVRKKILARAKSLGMTDLVERHNMKKASEESTPQDNSSNGEAVQTQDETKVEEQKTSQETLEQATEDAGKLRKLLDRAVAKIVSMKKEHTLTKASLEKTTNEELEKVKTDAEAKIELYKANAKTIIERQAELGEYAKDLSEKDILNDDKFARIKAEKENAELKAQLETSSDVISTKQGREDKDYENIRKEIDDKAFNFKKQK